MFKVKNPILYFFLLIIKILFNLILNNIYKWSRVYKIFLEKSFLFNSKYERNFGSSSLILLTNILALLKANFIIKK